jgi:hypothetical protein
MTQILEAPAERGAMTDTRITRIGAAAGIGGIVLIMAGFALAAPTQAVITAPVGDIVSYYTDSGLVRALAGTLLECMGILLFLPFAAMLTYRVRGAGASGSLLTTTARIAAGLYVGLNLAPGAVARGTALWLAHDGTTNPEVLVGLNTLGAFGHFLALLPYGLFLVTVGAAGVAAGGLPRWASWSAIGVGLILSASVAGAGYGATDITGMLSLIWVIAVSVTLLRRPWPPVTTAAGFRAA